MPNNYVWDNSSTEASSRLEALSALYDPRTIKHMEGLGIGPGWSCLEVGGGSGSIARWLSNMVGQTGRVLVTDINIRFLGDLRDLPNVEVVEHDIGKDELPKDKYDLVHARLVLLHVPQREQALAKMITSTKSGGWAMIEDFDNGIGREATGHDYHPTRGIPPSMSTRAFEKLIRAREKVMQSHGADQTYARRLYHLFRSHGLRDVEMEAFAATRSGGSKGSMLEKANTLQSKDEMLATGILTDSEFEEALGLMDDPEWARFAPHMISVWGRKP